QDGRRSGCGTPRRGARGHRCQPGQQVYGLAGFDRPGAAPEYVTVPAAGPAPGPAAVGHAEAAVLPLGALTTRPIHPGEPARPGHGRVGELNAGSDSSTTFPAGPRPGSASRPVR